MRIESASPRSTPLKAIKYRPDPKFLLLFADFSRRIAVLSGQCSDPVLDLAEDVWLIGKLQP